MAVKKVSHIIRPQVTSRIVDENQVIQLEEIQPKFGNGTERAIILGFEATTPATSKGRFVKRAKVTFAIGEYQLNQNFLLINYPGQLIYQLFMAVVGRTNNVTIDELLNKEVGLELKNVTTDKGIYTNVTRIFNVSELQEQEEDSHEETAEE
ncbi:MAG: hypothetical protein KIC47_09765 [Clostridium sp.]|uniref:hypothetical protein n=1 Tax=Clostridium neonatale TaxID=137838 RepID=UPI001D3D446C|nr:hypothetical protein [Clostridium neonatale]MBS5950589.1 hypothetical protein [Clostridium sp.]CAI3565170.1 conserved hypothetical protein [Clostridium neonatale]